MTTISPLADDSCLRSTESAATDAQLLEQFIQQKDESAFAELVRRHSAMVLGVCQRILHNPHDAEDCFQAAFLVLVRKAASIWPREMVGNWLYGVAYRTALEARKMAAKRREMERKKRTIPSAQHHTDLWQELRPVLDQELNRLPDKFRVVLILCDLEGKTRAEAAQQLGLPEGTVASRLARARAMLEKRLARHALSLSAHTLPAVLVEHAAANVPAALVASTVRAAVHHAAGGEPTGVVSPKVATLTECVVQALGVSKFKIALAASVLAAVLLCIGIGAFLPSALADKGTQPSDEWGPNKPKPIEFVQGCILRRIDLASQTLHATKVGASGGSEDAFDLEVDSATRILIDGEQRRLEDLQLGLPVNLLLERRAEGAIKALGIEAVSKSMQGVVLALDENTMTILQEDDDKGLLEKTYLLEKTAPIIINGKKAKLADLKAKMKVALQFSALKSVVLSVDAKGPRVKGVVKVIDIALHAISVHLTDAHLDMENVIVAKDAPVVIDGKISKLDDLQAGMPISLQMSAETDRSIVVGITSALPMKK